MAEDHRKRALTVNYGTTKEYYAGRIGHKNETCEDKKDMTTSSARRLLSPRRHSTGTILSSEDITEPEPDVCDQLNACLPRKLSRKISQENFIQNREAMKCSRFHSRRNALCDPLRQLLTQRMREQLEQELHKRKTSASRKVSHFLTVSLDLNRDEELI